MEIRHDHRSPTETVITDVLSAVAGDEYWESRLERLVTDGWSHLGFHLAIFIEPYLQYVLEGRKTVESRFSTYRTAPYGNVSREDVLLLKASGGPIVGICQVADVWFYLLDPTSWQAIRADFAQALCAQDPEFWSKREDARFATLMRIHHVRAIAPIRYTKRDRRGWVVLNSANTQAPLSNR